MAAWIVHAAVSGFPPRDWAKARDRKANRPIPRASRTATDWTYEEALRASAAEFPSSPVARAKRPAMETMNPNEAIRPTFRRTGKATPYARDPRASGSFPAGIHMKFAMMPTPKAIARPRNPIDRRATSRGETGAPPLKGGGKVPQAVPFASWTQYENDPAVKCPSTAEVAVHVTV